MDEGILKIAKVLGIPYESPRWAKGDAWFERPPVFRMYSRMAAVMEYVEAEFGIRDAKERELLHVFLHHLHSAFCNRLDQGESLEAVAFPPKVLQDFEADFDRRFPASVLVEKLRAQFRSGGSV